MEVEDLPLRPINLKGCPPGQDSGLEVELGTPAPSVAMAFPVLSPGILPIGSRVGLEAGSNGEPASQAWITQVTAGNTEITVDFSFLGSSTSRIEVYNEGTLMSSANGHVGAVARIDNLPSQIAAGTQGSAAAGGNPATVEFDFPFTTRIAVPGSGPVWGDRLRVIAEGGAPVEPYSNFDFLLRDLEEATVFPFAVPQFEMGWGSPGSAPGQFQEPRSLAANNLGFLYIPDSGNHRIQTFDIAGNYLFSWGTNGSGTGQLNQPRSVAVAPSQLVYVADTNNHRIQVFDPFGVYIGRWGSQGVGNGQFRSPTSVAVAPDGSVYVADSENKRVQKFDANGNFLLEFGTSGTGDGGFTAPAAIAVDPEGAVYVADNNRIQKFDELGEFVLKWGSPGTGNGQFNNPVAIAIDLDGTVLIADYGNRRLQKFTKLGTFLHELGTTGTGDGDLLGPAGVAYDIDNSIIVTDAVRNKVQKFDPMFQSTSDAPPSIPRTTQATLSGSRRGDGSIVFQYSIPRDGDSRLTVHDTSGRILATLVDGFLQAGSHSVHWSPNEGGGRPLPSGVYFGRLESGKEIVTVKTVIVH